MRLVVLVFGFFACIQDGNSQTFRGEVFRDGALLGSLQKQIRFENGQTKIVVTASDASGRTIAERSVVADSYLLHAFHLKTMSNTRDFLVERSSRGYSVKGFKTATRVEFDNGRVSTFDLFGEAIKAKEASLKTGKSLELRMIAPDRAIDVSVVYRERCTLQGRAYDCYELKPDSLFLSLLASAAGLGTTLYYDAALGQISATDGMNPDVMMFIPENSDRALLKGITIWSRVSE
jgi:hypothetical protein